MKNNLGKSLCYPNGGALWRANQVIEELYRFTYRGKSTQNHLQITIFLYFHALKYILDSLIRKKCIDRGFLCVGEKH